MDPVTSIVIVIAVVIMVIILARHIEKKRTNAIQEQARIYGFEFTPTADFRLVPDYSKFYLFSLGHSKRMKNVMHKSGGGTEEMIFDYAYVTGGGKSRRRHRSTVYLFDSERLHLPVFALRPEHLFHKIGHLFGYQDINFAQFPDFSKKYILRGKNEAAIIKVFTQEIISCFEQDKKICVESGGNALIVYWSGQRINSEQVFVKHEAALKIYLALLRRSEFIDRKESNNVLSH